MLGKVGDTDSARYKKNLTLVWMDHFLKIIILNGYDINSCYQPGAKTGHTFITQLSPFAVHLVFKPVLRKSGNQSIVFTEEELSVEKYCHKVEISQTTCSMKKLQFCIAKYTKQWHSTIK